jgi:hypothetical protein
MSMSWVLSRFRAGDLVEVRSKEEILATLDQDGCVDGLPFMPEMLRFCGQRMRVRAVAHKTCDTVGKPGTARRLQSAVHLDGARCDGSAHGGCQAACSLFWKDTWLKPAREKGSSAARVANGRPSGGRECTESQLIAKAQAPRCGSDEPRYQCQATMLLPATQPLPWWDARQYVFDVLTRNHSLGRVLRVLWLAGLRWLLPHVPFGYRITHAFSERMHRWLTGSGIPSIQGKIERGAPTPGCRLNVRPGEYVRIKSQDEIELTLDKANKNRGLYFDAEGEMSVYCDGVFKVQASVTKIIDEATGKMLHMKQPCLTLEGVVCNAHYAMCRLNCPRAIPSYWRDLWLQRVPAPEGARNGEELPRCVDGVVGPITTPAAATEHQASVLNP